MLSKSAIFQIDAMQRATGWSWAGSSLSQDDDRRPIMPECHIVNYSSLVGPSWLTTALEINRGDVESHLNQEGRLREELCH